MGLDETRNQNQPFREKTVVNGIEMGVGLGSQDYEIYFPDVEISPEEGIYDEVIRVGSSQDDAKKAFESAVELANSGKSAKEIYKEIQRTSRVF